MRKITFLIALFFSVTTYSQEDFIITINDKKMEVDLDQEYSLNLNGKEINFSISAKDTLTYKDEMFSFKYPKNYKISEIDLGDGVTQFVIMTAEGTGFMIQKYTTMSPTMMNEMMLNELTKESISYGFKMERKDYSKKLSSGHEVKVNKAVLTYKEDTNIYELMSIGKKDEGLILVTMSMSAELSPESRKLISMMWDSLSIY